MPMDPSRMPIEAMRVGGLPASGYRQRSGDESIRDMIDNSDRHDAAEAFPALRTCRCGTEVLRGSRADDDHLAECGPPDPDPEPEFTVVVPEGKCRACGEPANPGAAYCSQRCARLRTPENLREWRARRANRRANRARG